MQKLLLIIFVFTGIITANGQKLWQKQGLKIQTPVCYASDEAERAYIPPPAEVLEHLKSAQKKSEIIVNYSLFPAEAKVAFEYAASIWERLIDSPVPIYIQANWRTKQQNVLGSCGPTDFKKNFDGAPRKNIFYPISLVEKLQRIELTGPERPDMIAEFNREINWYFGTDGNTPIHLYDFVSVVLHEIGHGLGFTGFFFALDLTGGYSWWEWGDATTYDRMVENLMGEQLIDSSIFTNPSVNLKNALTSNSLYANSPSALAMGSRSRPRLYAPSSWDDGSSIYHLNTATYPPGNINSLMTHSYARGLAIHDPGPHTLGMMADMGWKNMWIEHIALKDREKITPLHFEVKITSDYPLDLSQLFVVFSTDSFASPPDSIPLLNSEPTLYEAVLSLEPDVELIQYYISAGDMNGRTFRYPSEFPMEYLSVNFGPDLEMPTIDHEPIPFFFDTGDSLIFVAYVDDNQAVDTVFVEYSLNGIPQEPFGLSHDSGTIYSAPFPLESKQLNDLDLIEYQIIAVDVSFAQNIGRFPETGTLTFTVEKMFEPITGYINHFEADNNDFILSDFEIYTDSGFTSGALHSPHPYPSPDQDDTEFNFVTILKYPIILTDDATMSFDEIVLVEPGNDGTRFGDFEFWDFVIVEGSKDSGKTWLPLADGYDSREYEIWEESFYSSIANMNSTTVGSPDLYINRQIDMLENENFSTGDTILIRFRLFSDPYVHGWGWAIDNLRIQSPVSVPLPVLSPGNIMVYPNPFTNSFHVKIDSNNSISLLQFDVYNLHGQKVKSVNHKNISGQIISEITLENAVNGIYLLVVRENGKQVLTKKLIHN
jgi:hypothetical protein